MNKLQQVEFEILREFIKVCEKLNLQYYLICGSALGAAKYNGFIPWDDDIDVALPRKDYLIFIEQGRKMLPNHLFIQNYKTEDHYHHFCSKIRDSRTTYIESDQKNLNIHHGVFIDVIPLDSLPQEKNFKYKYRCFRICQLIYLQSREKYKNIIKRVLKLFVNIKTIYTIFEKYLCKYAIDEPIAYCNFHNSKNNKLYMDVNVYGKGVYMKFEGIDVIIPEKFDEYLTAYYGDWRAELPNEQKVGHHYAEKIDLSKPYTSYFEKLSNGKIKLKI